MYVIDPRGEVIRWNKNAETILGYSRQELSALNILDLIAEDGRERVASKWSEAFTQGGAMGEAHVLTKEGRRVPFLLSAVRAHIGDKVYVIGTGIDVTERKRAEQALTISEARYRTLIERAPDAIVVADMETERFVDFNENACHLFGCSREDLLQIGPLDFCPSVQPDGRPSRQVLFAHADQAWAGQVPVFEWTIRNALGAEIPCEVRLVRLPSGERKLIRGSITDITERKQAERALRASQEMFYRAFHSSPEPICILKFPGGKFLDANKAFCDRLGYLYEEVIGRSAHELGLAPLSELNAQQLRLLAQGGLRDLEMHLHTKSGEVRNALVSLEMVEITGQSCILAQGRDVTEYRRAEKPITSEQRYRDFIAHGQEGVWRFEFEPPLPIDLPAEKQLEWALEYAYVAECNDAMARFVGAPSAEGLIGRRIKDLGPMFDEKRIETYRSTIKGGYQNRTIQFQSEDMAGPHQAPAKYPGTHRRGWDADESVGHDAATSPDLHQAKEALRASEQRYRLLFERNLAAWSEQPATDASWSAMKPSRKFKATLLARI